MSGPLVLLGPQRPTPNAPAALAEFTGDGPVVVIAAGWRHDESDEDVLRRHLGPDVSVLPIYAWFEVVMRELPEVAAAYRRRQRALIELKALHRVRLDGALEVVHQLRQAAGGGDSHALALRQAQEDVARIDRQLLVAADRIRAEHEAPWLHAPRIEGLRQRAAQILASARAVVIPGGHVAVLVNRMAFFGIGDRVTAVHRSGTPVIAWSAGAMALTERVVLFYDDPPEGPVFPEILDRGVGMVEDLVMLPHVRQRLRLDLPWRVDLLATRFAPSAVLGLDNGAWLARGPSGWWNRGPAGSACWLRPGGGVAALPIAVDAPRADAVAVQLPEVPPATEPARGQAMRPILELSGRLAVASSGRSELVDRFVADHRFPLTDSGTAVFFVRAPGAEAVYLVHWVFGLEGRQPLLPLQDTDAFYLPLELPHDARVEYKLEVVDADGHRWIHDPLNPQRAFDPFGSNSVCAMPGYRVPRWSRSDPQIRAGQLQSFSHHSAVYGESRTVEVYLPREYKPSKRYPVVVCHDGRDYLRFAEIKTVLDNLIGRHEVAPLVVAFINGTDRNREYGADDRQPDYLVRELIPELARRYGISDDPSERGLMGASFGAVSSLYCAWRHPGVFGRLLLQSGSFVYTDIGHHGRSSLFDPVVAFVNEFRDDPGRTEVGRVFLSCGTFESLIWFNRSLPDLFRGAGIETRFVEAADGHNWIAWRDRLREGLAWLFPGRLWYHYE